MRRQTYLRDENLLTLLSLHDFIIPEIQREYVWGSQENCDKVLKPFMESIKEHAAVNEHCKYAHSKENCHIGFLYSYKPQYIRDLSSRIIDEYLIDGQQRFTSLFLLLLVRAVKEEQMNDFCNLIRWEEESIAFDYKVRQLTHRFIYDLIEHLKEKGNETLEDICKKKYPHWFLKDYQEDTTVSNIIRAIQGIVEVFEDSDGYYYDYLLTRIHFWHFKTDVTSQGEELYITMNSRGEELSNNEVQKSRRLQGKDLAGWGKTWEEWQTYFWRKRGEGGKEANFDADKGFNNFLACIEAMGSSFGFELDSIEQIQTFVDALKFMVDTDWTVELEQKNYYTVWIDTLKQDIWSKINTTAAKWLIEKDSDTIQRENAVLLWPLFYYYFRTTNEPDKMTFIRLMHLCYLNYHSKKTNNAYIKDFVDALVTNKSDMTNLNDDCFKEQGFISEEHSYLSELIKDNPKLESLIWEIQDKPYFLDGEDVGGNTIIDYIRSIKEQDIDIIVALEKLKDNYDVMFPQGDVSRNEILLKRILLHYKDDKNNTFWKQTAPYYDRNYETSSWKRIVRHGAFLNFYIEISGNHLQVLEADTLNELIKNKQEKFFEEERNRIFNGPKWSDRRLAIFFDAITDGKLWNKDEEKLLDLGFHDDPELENALPFIGHTTVGNRACGRKFQWDIKVLPDDWQETLQKKYNCNFKFSE